MAIDKKILEEMKAQAKIDDAKEREAAAKAAKIWPAKDAKTTKNG